MSTSSRRRFHLNSQDPDLDPVLEGERIADAARAAEVTTRLTGGVAIALRCPSAQAPPLARTYQDIDLVTLGSHRDATMALLESLGYLPDREFNTLHGSRRLFFWDPANERQLDVFVDRARLCHEIDFRPRLAVSERTLPLADLLLMKLQVVETNEKDLIDICALLADHDLTEGERGVNSAYLASLAGDDWGLWRTMTMVASRAEDFVRGLARFHGAALVTSRLRELGRQLEEAPKSRGWKLRARLGERKRWYQLPEEIA
jgi:hypothetical protein